jgi:hypothetical protein
MTRPNFYFAMVRYSLELMHGNDPAMLTVAAREHECARREDSVSARERNVLALADAVQQEEDEHKAAEDEARAAVIADLTRKIDAFSARLDAYEAELNKDPDDDLLPLPPDLRRSQELAPPGPVDDSGDLQASEGPDYPRSEEEAQLLHPPGDDAEGDLPAELTEKVTPSPGTDPDLTARAPTSHIPASTSMW